LATLLSKQETRLPSNSTYTYLALFFPVFVILAPLIYNFACRVQIISGPPAEVTLQGRIFTFLLAAALTVWGAVGQVEIQAGLVLSLLHQKKIDSEPMIALQVLFVVVFGALPFYAWLTMNAAVRIQSDIAPRRSFREAINEARDWGWPLL